MTKFLLGAKPSLCSSDQRVVVKKNALIPIFYVKKVLKDLQGKLLLVAINPQRSNSPQLCQTIWVSFWHRCGCTACSTSILVHFHSSQQLCFQERKAALFLGGKLYKGS